MAGHSSDLVETLLPYGARPDNVVVLSQAEPAERIRYLDLVRHLENNNDLALWPHAVVEVDGQPVLYVVDNAPGTRFGQHEIARLRRVLAFRAGADRVALIEPGRLTVYPVTPTKELPTPKSISPRDPEAPALIPSLAFPPAAKNVRHASSTSAAVHKLLYALLSDTTNDVKQAGVDELAALSLVGRALFVRFLIDRRVLGDVDIQAICGSRPEECFSSYKRAAQMSEWLDETFNGDFLPLPEHGSLFWFRKRSSQIFSSLTNILHRATSAGQLHLTWGDGWNDLLFDHIPTGLLSQVYEQHAHRYDAVNAKAKSVHYTPRHVAEYMVDEVFFSLGSDAPHARVLDPAVGGGVFLVAAFRRLAAESWKANGRPPDTQALRNILYGQLTGFDISEPALRLCSLGLYLTAIELDPNPRPLKRLKFTKPLLGRVLHDVRSTEKNHTYIGSLNPDRVGPEHRAKYDVVVGNPPWTNWKETEFASKADIDGQVAVVEEAVRKIVRERVDDNAAKQYEMTDKVPDLPFFWRALEWARPGGWIALTMHGRLLFKQSAPGRRARDELFSAVQITGILNGTSIRDTQFWPKVRAPFCLVFAQNVRPADDNAFFFVSPELEEGLNNRGRLRIDSTNAQPVAPSILRTQPTLLKTLFRGTSLDVSVIERIRARASTSLDEYWEKHGYKRGEGFKVNGDGMWPADDIYGKPELNTDSYSLMPYLVLPEQLPILQHQELHRPRNPKLYEGPLVIVGEVPPLERSAISGVARLALGDVVFSESFFGFSCADAPKPQLLARYLFLLLNSHLPLYFSLLTSSKFGVERDVFLLEDIKRLPFVPLETLSPKLTREILPLSDALIKDPGSSFEALDTWVGNVYELSRWDRQVISDSLEVAPPFAHTRARAQERPDEKEIARFIQQLSSVVQPFFARHGRRLAIQSLRNEASEPWVVMRIDSIRDNGKEEKQRPAMTDKAAIFKLTAEADSLAASQLFVIDSPSTLLLGIVAQYRYFTPSRARITALTLLDEFRDVLFGEPLEHGR
jgi:hypothetical protein